MNFPILAFIGRVALQSCRFFGRYTLFVAHIVHTISTTPLKKAKIFVQMDKIGLHSLPISLLTGIFAGAVMALQTYTTFQKFGSEKLVGPVVALIMARELGPVLTGLMVAGRCSSGIAAEIGTMKITEQIDALETLCVDNFQYLIVPRVLAATIILPFLTIFSTLAGIIGGYLVCIHVFGLNPIDYIDGVKDFLTGFDMISGVIKAIVFGFVLSSIGAFQGFNTKGGAKGVGIATTQSVVGASIAILVCNYFLSTLLFGGI